MKITISKITILSVALVTLLFVFYYCFFIYQSSFSSESKRTETFSEIGEIKRAILAYKKAKGILPSKLEDLCHPENPERMDIALLEKEMVNDPWGNEYIYTVEEKEALNVFTVFSYGADGQAGGTGENEDITSKEVVMK